MLHLKNIPFVWTIPAVLIIVRSIWYWNEESTFSAWTSRLSMIIGFLLYPGGLDSIINYFSAIPPD